MKNKTFLNPKIHNLNYGQKTLRKSEVYILQLLEVTIQQTSRNCKKFYICSVFCPSSFSGVEMVSKLEDFDNFLLLDKGLKDLTRKGHITSISIVLDKIENPTKENLRKHVIWMYKQNYSYSHIVNTIKAIEYFTEYKGDPIKIKRTKKPKKLIHHYLTEGEIGFMIRSADTLRKKAMITLLAFSGVRNREFCNIKVKDLDFGNNQATVRQGKNSKDRKVNIGYKCVNLLMDYIMKYNKKQEDYLFTTIKENNRYKPSDLRKFVKVLAKRAKIDKKVFPHILRHSLATNLILRGANVLLVKEQLGHTDIQTTMNYIQRLPIQTIKTQFDYHIPAYL